MDPSLDMREDGSAGTVNALGASDYFNLLAKLMKDNPPAAADKPDPREDGETGDRSRTAV